MRAWRVRELGEPGDVLALEDLPVPEPGPGQVRIRVAAAACNFTDVLMCRGGYQMKPPLPFTPGSELAGTIDAAGEGVTDLQPGDRVLGTPAMGCGGFAELALASGASLYPVPATMAWPAAAALHVTYQTGHVGLHHRGALQPGETLLVHAGAGGIGSAAIQLGLAAGARVFATAGGSEKAQVCRDLGVELVVDYRADDFVDAVKDATGGRGADVIYDPVGGDTFDRSRRCIAFEGRILVIGFTSGRIADAPTNHALVKNYAVVGVNWGAYGMFVPGLVRATHAALVELHDAGQIAPLVSAVLPLDDLPTALERLASRGTWGKVVVAPDPAAVAS